MKASNPLVMVQAYRLLAEEMYLKGWDYPLHLGVTEVMHGYSGRQAGAPTCCLACPHAPGELGVRPGVLHRVLIHGCTGLGRAKAERWCRRERARTAA